MSASEAGGPAEIEPAPDLPRRDNGLHATRYVPLTDVADDVGRHLLQALGRARIPAYLHPSGADSHPPLLGVDRSRPGGTDPSGFADRPTALDQAAAANQPMSADRSGLADRRESAPVAPARSRLFVASEDRIDARTIVVSAMRALDIPNPTLAAWRGGPDPDPVGTATTFAALVADWHVDTVAAVRKAERDLNHEDAEWRGRLNPPTSDEVNLDEEHYVPPPPPPLPRLAATTVIALLVAALSVFVLIGGTWLTLPGDFTVVLGIGGLVLAGGLLFTRVRDFVRDEDDDGSAI